MRTRDKIATKEDWEINSMPEKNTVFEIERHFTDEEIENLKFGHIPQEMEDRWFSYFEDNKLYIHRSWSGNCIYIVEFHFKRKSMFDFKINHHNVIVNRDEDQYSNNDIREDINLVNELLDDFAR